jgi:lysozyme
MWRVTSARGREMIESFEGRRHTAYPDPATGGKPWTIGIGSTGPDVVPGLTWTDQEIDERFTADLRKFEVGINKLVTAPISQNAFDAVCSLAYNIGLQNLRTSTLLKLLNQGRHRDAAAEFYRWSFANGQQMPGLLRRRRAEMALFVSRD